VDQSEQLIINELKLDENKASNAVIFGSGLNYYFRLPVLRSVTAIKNVAVQGELQKETIDFISVTNPEQKITTLRVYDKPDWQSLSAETQKSAGTVVLDFMDYIFVLAQKEPNPYINGSPDATGYDEAYQAIAKAAAKAFVYNPGGVEEPVHFDNTGGYANLYVGGQIVSDKILFDEENRPILPVRALGEALGYKIDWDAESSSFIILKGDSLVASKSVASGYTSDNYKDAGQITCAIIDGSVYIDLDFVVNTLNCAVSLDESLRAITVRER
jgi:hypothetical protein